MVVSTKVPFKSNLTHRRLVETELELVVVLPELRDGRHGNRNGAVIRLPKLIHLVLILPASAPNLTWAALDELDPVLPQLTRFAVHSDVVNDELEGLADNLARLAIWIVGEVVPPANVVDVGRPELHIRNSE